MKNILIVRYEEKDEYERKDELRFVHTHRRVIRKALEGSFPIKVRSIEWYVDLPEGIGDR